MIDQPLNTIVVLKQTRHHQILGRHNKVRVFVAQTIQMVVTAFVLLEAAHRYAARADRIVVIRCELHYTHDRPLCLIRVGIALFELTEYDNLIVGYQRSKTAYVEIRLKGGD